jgi:hypothetical protein
VIALRNTPALAAGGDDGVLATDDKPLHRLELQTQGAVVASGGGSTGSEELVGAPEGVAPARLGHAHLSKTE